MDMAALHNPMVAVSFFLLGVSEWEDSKLGDQLREEKDNIVV
jgi:hypothetical protein